MSEQSGGRQGASGLHPSTGGSSRGRSREQLADALHDVRDELARSAGLGPAEVVELLCEDQVRRWLAGQRVPAETYLALHPALEEESEAVFELIYGEFMLRESLGEAPTPEEFVWRFPQFAARLRRQLGIHDALQTDEIECNARASTVTLPSGRTSTGFKDRTGLPVIPGYDLLAILGRGATGVVYKARQVALKRLVALKVIRLSGTAAPDIGVRFRAEAEAVARFLHPNIVQVYEVGERDAVGFLALEYAAGGNLQERLVGTPQPPRESARLLESLARAVDYAHRRGIVHRDLKPANVVLTGDGIPKITDFGLAKLMEQDGGHTRTGDILGTPSYMAPEQARGAPTAGAPTADIYALGAILYEMLTGRPPFKGATPLSTLEQVSTQEPLPPGKFQRQTPRDLETICLKCLEKDPKRRYPTALDLAEDLRRFLDGRPIVARPAPAWERACKWAKRRPGAAASLASAVLAIVALYGGALYYNAKLRGAVNAARTAERSALDQRNLALKALNQLVYGVQEKLADTPATRPLRRSLLDTAIAGLDEIARSAEASAPDLSRAVAHQKLGEIFREIGRSDEAIRQLEYSRRLAESLAAAAPRDLAIKECLSRTCAGLGELHLRAGRHDPSKSFCRRVVELTEAIAKADPRREGARRNRIEAYLQLGRAHGFASEFGTAESIFREVRGLAAQWVAEEPQNNQAKDLLSSSYRKLADMRKLVNDPAGARADYLRAIAIDRGLLAVEPGNVEFKSHLALALHDLAGVLHGQRKLADARPLYREAARLFAEMVEADPDEVPTRHRLIRVQSDSGRLERDDLRFTEAAELFRQAIGHLRWLEREGRPTDARALSMLENEIADCEDAPVALGNLDGIRALSARAASRLLKIRIRAFTAQQRPSDAATTAEAVCTLEADEPEDLFLLARALAECAECLDDERWPEPSRERQTLRQRCSDRAAALLARVRPTASAGSRQ